MDIVKRKKWAALRYYAGGGASYSAEYQAVLDYATLQGYTLPSDPVKSLQDTLMQYFVANGIITDADSILILTGDGDINFKLIDWKTVTKRATVTGSLVISNTLGPKSDGTTGAIDLGYNSISRGDYQNNKSFYIHVTTAAGPNSRTAFGQIIATGNFNMFRPKTATNTFNAWLNSGGSGNQTLTGGIGRVLLDRSINTDFEVYQNGSLVANPTPSSNSGTTVGNMYLFALNSSLTGTPSIAGFFPDNIAVWIEAVSLKAKLAGLDAAYNTYYTSLLAL